MVADAAHATLQGAFGQLIHLKRIEIGRLETHKFTIKLMTSVQLGKYQSFNSNSNSNHSKHQLRMPWAAGLR